MNVSKQYSGAPKFKFGISVKSAAGWSASSQLFKKRLMRRQFRSPLVVMGVAALAACDNQANTNTDTRAAVEWPRYAGDDGGTKYSRLSEINRTNVVGLKVAWMTRVADFPPHVFSPSGHRAGSRREDGTAIPARAGASCGVCHKNPFRFEVTPVMWRGTLFLSTPRNRVLALDPGTGATRWTFDPQIDVRQTYAEQLTSRGVAVWSDPAPENRICAHRIFLTTVDASLYAIDAETGLRCADFGLEGEVNLLRDVALEGRSVDSREFSVTSPPAIVKGLVIVGSSISKNRARSVASGVVRAYDVRSGARRWSFDPIPRTEDNPAWPSWNPSAARATGGANVWSIVSSDSVRDLIILPTGSPAPDAYGGERPGRNDFANSIVALTASTGSVRWSFQVVRHDLWDYDVAAQPLLVELRRHGALIPAVVVGTKTGMIFVVDRRSGAPLWPVYERPVPTSDVPGEKSWPTQPFSTLQLLPGNRITPDSAFGVTPKDLRSCREQISNLRNEGTFTPPSLNGTLVWPGYWGGINWDGIAWDPSRQLIVTTIKRLATTVQLHRRAEKVVPPDRNLGGQHAPQLGTPYSMTRAPLVAPSGIPCTPPPWGSLIALDLVSGVVRWNRPLGIVPWLQHLEGSADWGSLVFGGPLITAGGLVFIGASQDDMFRAFDIETGTLLWEHRLPAGGQATPITYRIDGRQYVVIAAGGRAGIGNPGDWIVAFALP